MGHPVYTLLHDLSRGVFRGEGTKGAAAPPPRFLWAIGPTQTFKKKIKKRRKKGEKGKKKKKSGKKDI